VTERRKRELSGTLEIDGWPLRWTLKSEQVWDPHGEHLGLRLSVERSDEAHRELVLEYPFVDLGKTGRPDVNVERIEADIRQAMGAGWKPKSRGRPFIFVLD
jgi:hypothetical protein